MLAKHQSRAPRKNSVKQSGFSLMEVLIAMLVLAIGLLGLAALQTQGLRFNAEAYSRTQATSLAYQIIEIMRADRDNADDYEIDAATLDGFAANPGNPSNCTATLVATPTATAQLTCWIESLKLALPEGQGSIVLNADASNNYYNVTVSWLDRELSSGYVTVSGDSVAKTQGRCEAIAGRTWDSTGGVAGDLGICRVNQVWTVFP